MNAELLTQGESCVGILFILSRSSRILSASINSQRLLASWVLRKTAICDRIAFFAASIRCGRTCGSSSRRAASFVRGMVSPEEWVAFRCSRWNGADWDVVMPAPGLVIERAFILGSIGRYVSQTVRRRLAMSTIFLSTYEQLPQSGLYHITRHATCRGPV